MPATIDKTIQMHEKRLKKLEKDMHFLLGWQKRDIKNQTQINNDAKKYIDQNNKKQDARLVKLEQQLKKLGKDR